MARPLLRNALRTLWMLLLVANLQAQQGARLRLVSADLLENVQVDGEVVQILSGKVKFQKGDMVMTTELARFFEAEGKTVFRDGVVMVRPGERLTCDNIVFHDVRNLIEARGSVRLEQNNQVVTSRELFYYTALDSAVAVGDVVMTQDDRQLTADRFRSVQGDGERGASFWAQGEVRIEESQRNVAAESMVYTDIDQKLELLGETSIEQDNQLLKGERLTLYYDGDKIRNAVVEKGAEATSLINALMTPEGNDWRTFTDVLTGRRMEALFQDGSLTTLNIEGMATSVYHLVEDSVLQGINHASGDTMTLGFDSTGYLNRLQVRGGGRGRFEPERANSEVDTVVLYKGAYIDYDIPGEVTHLDRDARVDYRGNGLEAGSIVVTWRDNLMRAEPQYNVRPTLYQTDQDPMEGDLMEFDLVAERGRVLKGKTRLDAGYYHGAVIHRHPDNVYYVENSVYTTCSLDRPHFYFASNRMKMIQGDKVIARPIILYIMDVPVLGLPFAVFPNQPGRRRSGWIMPSYGDNRFSGQHLQGLGYFWALNDYIDLKTLVDFYSKKGIRSTSRLRYSRRGKFGGGFGLRLYRELLGNDIADLFTPERTKTPWSGSWTHSQTFDPTQRLSVSATYTSDPQINRQFGQTLKDRLNQQTISSASYTKQWRQSGSNLSLAMRDRYDLQAEEKLQATQPTAAGQRIVERTQTLPRLTFSRGRRAVFGSSQRWYSGISMQLSSELNNSNTIFWESIRDTSLNDSIVWNPNRQIDSRTRATHRISLNNSGKLLRYLSVSMGMSLVEGWAPSHFEADVDDNGLFVKANGTIVSTEVEEFSPRHTGNISVSLQTNIYGLFPVNIGGLQAIRHTIKPSVSYSYAPDFSEPVLGVDLGYFETDAAGEKFDRFSGSTIGGTSRSEQQILSLSLKNLFQGKREKEGKEEKFMILDWTMSSGYNFVAEKFKISPIRSSFRSPFLQKLNLDIQMVHDFYEWDKEAQTKIDRVLSIPRLSQMSATTRISLSGKHLVPQKEGTVAAVNTDSIALADSLFDQITEYGEITTSRSQQVAPTVGAGNLWEANFGIRYRLQPSLDKDIAESFWLDSAIKLAIGGGWSIGYNARFDMLDQELVTHDVRLYRKIHCWEMRFNWTPGGPGQGYFLSINVIDSDLKDIKYESRGGRQSFFGRN